MLVKFIRLIILVLLCPVGNNLLAQCTTSISTFPYNQDFETSDGGFVAGGNSSSWAYGTPTKTVINAAASGTKCWVTAGLATSGYNNGENSTLTSPCYDFSSLTNPFLSFKIFWETENKYDGANIQYSIDGGTNWTIIGTVGDNNNCSGTNWFNTPQINSLGSSPGWTGNIQPTSICQNGAGGGSGQWLTAQHTLTMLAGKPSVKFKFQFGAGNQCNNYDGFAIDDFSIYETPTTNYANFSYNCLPNNNIKFTNLSSLCGTYFWNFGDPGSSLNNTSTVKDPTHLFSAPGTYTVTLTSTYSTGALTKTQQITVIQPTAYQLDQLFCYGDKNGAVSVLVQPAGTYNYTWNTTPAQNTQQATNLGAGTYTVTVNGTNVCTLQATVALTQPNRILATFTKKNAICGSNNGRIEAAVTGGQSPYLYQWSNAQTAATIQNLAAGSYTLRITDNDNCVADTFAAITNELRNLRINLGADTFFCPGNTLTLNPGNFSSYTWQDNSINNTYTVSTTGTYAVKVVDADGCIASDQITITVDCSDVYFPSAFTPNGDGRNDGFGPVGNVAALRNYTLQVYGRWGQKIFATTNPFTRWDGTMNGNKLDPGTYVYITTYTLNGQPASKKGTIVIVR